MLTVINHFLKNNFIRIKAAKMLFLTVFIVLIFNHFSSDIIYLYSNFKIEFSDEYIFHTFPKVLFVLIENNISILLIVIPLISVGAVLVGTLVMISICQLFQNNFHKLRKDSNCIFLKDCIWYLIVKIGFHLLITMALLLIYIILYILNHNFKLNCTSLLIIFLIVLYPFYYYVLSVGALISVIPMSYIHK